MARGKNIGVIVPAFCSEENVYQLCCALKQVQQPLYELFVVFVSNQEKAIPLWRQRASRFANGLVVWDYHVFCVQLKVGACLQGCNWITKDKGITHMIDHMNMCARSLPHPLFPLNNQTMRHAGNPAASGMGFGHHPAIPMLGLHVCARGTPESDRAPPFASDACQVLKETLLL